MRTALRLLLTAATGLILGAAAPGDRSMQPIAGDPVATASGRIAGTALPSGVRAYLGVPYAAPPVGERRWAPPAPLAWSGIWNADRKGAACIQVLRPHDINHYFGEEPISEDCLFLNLWTPAAAKPGAKLPVIVFLYGGGFTIGSSGMANYDGEAMAKAGAVFVNFNYRVGALGFLAHPELSREQGGHSGNYGFMDQLAALRWLHDNVAKFGGDPEKVVIMGQSAGAGSVVTQIFNPEAKGLFRAAVMSSGCNFGTDGPLLAEAEKTGVALQQRLGAAGLDAMRQIPADRILAVQSENQLGVRVEGVRIGGPVIDGHIVPARKAELLAAGRFNPVPIVAGYNTNDLSFGFEPILSATTVAGFEEGARKLYGDDAPAFLALYPVASDAEVHAVARIAATEAGFEASARFCAQAQSRAGLPAYIDEYARVHPYVPGVRIADQDTATVGAYHTADIPYWFGTQDKYNMFRPTRNWQPWDRTLSRQMMQALIALADTGSPSTAAMPWPAWTPAKEQKLVLGDSVRAVTLDSKRLDWLAAHPVTPGVPPRRPGGNPID
ncbi:MAG: carboxylesterase family protein [Pseudomonadota bacterium]